MLRRTAYYKAFFSYWKILLLEIQKKPLRYKALPCVANNNRYAPYHPKPITDD